jgi:hypothetical protein
MGSNAGQEAFVIYALTIHKVIKSSDVIWAEEGIASGYEKCA